MIAIFHANTFSTDALFGDCNETTNDWSAKSGTLLDSNGPRMREERRPLDDVTDFAATSTCSSYIFIENASTFQTARTGRRLPRYRK